MRQTQSKEISLVLGAVAFLWPRLWFASLLLATCVLVFCLFGIRWVMCGMVVELLAGWKGHLGSWCSGEIWKTVPLCLIWCI
jgi:hypothetical protein